ncbi:MAG: hypothetical protein AAF846_15185 [Chloroflexota bacterium]
MDVNALLFTALSGANEILAAGIVIIAISLLLYNLTRNLNNRVARTSGAVLASVTFAYVVDVYLSLGPNDSFSEVAARIQWIGLAFIPSTLFHLSDALLATTGLPSRGRRKTVVRVLYIISITFAIFAIFTDSLVQPRAISASDIWLEAELASFFPIYVAFFITACVVTFINVDRARRRCLTAGSKRRMAYLQFAILTPAFGIFPYSVLLPNPDNISLVVQLFVNIANIIVIIMLIFLSYPLSFFGSDVPDRVVKVELLRFLLRGPGTALVVLAVIVGVGSASDIIISLPADVFLPFGLIAAVLFWQWTIHLGLPYLENWLIYRDEDDEQLTKLQDLSDKMLTRGDLLQLLGATLEAMCDYLRTDLAFVVSINNGYAELIQSTRHSPIADVDWSNEAEELRNLAENTDRVTGRSAFQKWRDWYLVPLYSTRINETNGVTLIGMLGIQTADNPTKMIDEQDTNLLYDTYIARTEQTLDDLLLQSEIYAALEGLLPQITTTRSRDDLIEYRPGRTQIETNRLPDEDELYEQVRAALRHYWGGPGISRSRLLDLQIVKAAMQEAESAVQALRTILQLALESLRPETTRSNTATEWTLYNIIDLRFIEGKKVRDVARRMSMSEADLYRKQRLAIEEMAKAIVTMEKDHKNPL